MKNQAGARFCDFSKNRDSRTKKDLKPLHIYLCDSWFKRGVFFFVVFVSLAPFAVKGFQFFLYQRLSKPQPWQCQAVGRFR